MAMRYGMAGACTFTGIDHCVHAHNWYVPILPDVLAEYALALVYLPGAAELAGALGLVMPLAIYRRLALPNLRPWTGIGLAVLLVFLVANVNVAVKGRGPGHGRRLDVGPAPAGSNTMYNTRVSVLPWDVWAVVMMRLCSSNHATMHCHSIDRITDGSC